MNIETWIRVLSILNAAIIPIVFIAIRHSVKRHRQEIVKDLSTIFSRDSAAGAKQREGGAIPSFEFLKYKYYLSDLTDERKNPPRDHSISSWMMGSIPFFIVVFGFTYLILFKFNDFSSVKDFIQREQGWVLAIAAAFTSGYIFSIRAFYRAVNNFDLSPATFVGGAINLVSGSILAIVAVELVFLPASKIEMPYNPAIPTALLVAFAVGAMPEVAIRSILRRSQIKNYKKEDINIYQSFLTTSIEVVDGIDVEIRDRLADYHIRSTQNLAAANPLMLFVETPYGVYQIMDWVAQAQLCSSVGPKALVKLWRLGIRTLFDLERAASHKSYKDKCLLMEIGKIIFDEHLTGSAERATAFDMNIDTIIADIQIRLDDPHVHRLRQIYIQIGERIGEDSMRLPFKNFTGNYERNNHEEPGNIPT